MLKKKKITIFVIIILLCATTLVIKTNLNYEEDIYVLSEDNNKEIDISENIDKEKNISKEEVTVYISGEVNNPGIVTLKNDERLAVAVEKVGGVTKEADLNKINMAIKLEDEKHYIIPKIGEETNITQNEEISVSGNLSSSNESKININSATIEELEKLPGVGEATANKIINYRNENGEFKSIEELKNVNGIGDKKYADMKNMIAIH